MTETDAKTPARRATRILGIDPGLSCCGYGIVDADGPSLRAVDYGAVKSTTADPLPRRIVIIYEKIAEMFEIHKPDVCAVESLFFYKNAKSAFQVGHVRGALIMCASLHGAPVFEYSPLEVKQAAVGFGRAEKQQVQYMMKMILGLAKEPSPPDAADALAVAVTHANSIRFQKVAGGGAVALSAGRRR